MTQNRYSLICHCCGEQRLFTSEEAKRNEHRFYKPERDAVVYIRVFYMHDHERAEIRLAGEWDMTLEEFKATRID